MSLRVLFGLLASGLPDQQNYSDIIEIPAKVMLIDKNFTVAAAAVYIDYAGAAKLHIGMLTISLILGLAYGGYVAYSCWMKKDALLGYIRNLVIALVLRTFFSILFDGVVLLGSPCSAGGANTLTSFEQICLNLVLGFWLSLTVYLHARIQRGFNSEPTLRLYQYGIPVVAVFFALVWIFTLQGDYPYFPWWFILASNQWIVNSANLLFILIQLVLVADMARMMAATKSSQDNDSVSLLWKVTAMMGALVLIFWLQFGLSLGPYKKSQSYLYFFFFIDGLEGTLVFVCLYFFNMWVALFINKSCVMSGSEEADGKSAESNNEEFLPGGRGIVTIDSMFMTNESGRWKDSQEEEPNDIVYSNVVEPHRLQKTLELYKRFDVIPSKVTVIEGEEFYECQPMVEAEMKVHKSSLSSIPSLKVEETKRKEEKMFQPVQKKNAFYSSKYLILDSKEGGDFPKYLETRPSLSSMSEKDSEKEERSRPASLDAGDLVRMWLNKNLEALQKNKKTATAEIGESNRSFKSVLGKDIQVSHPQAEAYKETLTREKIDIPLTNEKFDSEVRVDKLEESQPVEKEKIEVELNKDFNESATKMQETARNTEIMKSKMKTDTPSILSVPKQSDADASSLIPTDSSTSNIDKTATDAQVINKITEASNNTIDGEPKELESFTYSDLLKYRSERGDSEGDRLLKHRHSLSEGIFSAIQSYVTSVKVFPKAEQETPKVDKSEGHTTDETFQRNIKNFQKNKKLSKSGQEELKPSLDLIKEWTVDAESNRRHSEGIKKREEPVENDVQSRQEKLNLSSDLIKERTVDAESNRRHSEGFKKREEPIENDKFEKSVGKLGFLKQLIFSPTLKHEIPTKKKNIGISEEKPAECAEDNRSPEDRRSRKQSLENEFDGDNVKNQIGKQEFIVNDTNRKIHVEDSSKDKKHSNLTTEDVQPRSDMTEKSTEDIRTLPDIRNRAQLLECEAESNKIPEEMCDVPRKVKSNIPKNERHSKSEQEELKPLSGLIKESAADAENKKTYRENIKDGEKPEKNDVKSYGVENQKKEEDFEQQMLTVPSNINRNQETHEMVYNLINLCSRKDSLSSSTCSDSEFSVEKRQSSSEFSVERLSTSIKTLQLDQIPKDLPISDDDSQMHSLEKSTFHEEKRPSSSDEFSIDQYCAKVMAVSAKFQNQPSPLFLRKNNKSAV